MKLLTHFFIFFILLLPVFAEKEDPKEDPARRFQEFINERAFPFGTIPDYARESAIKQMEQMFHDKNAKALMLAQQPEWKNIGPFDIGGRIKSIAVHPTNPDICYAGAAAGGIWKTTDGGQNWTPIFDFENAIAFGALGMDQKDPNTIYAGTGEAVNNGTTYLGSGIFKTTDAGVTWNVTGLTFVGAFSKVIVHPKNSNYIFAGATKRGKGLYRSTDGGSTWLNLYKASVTDVTVNPQNINELMIGVDGVGVLYTSDGGQNWEDRSADLGSSIGRVSVQIAPSETNIAYCLLENGGIGNIYKTTNKGQNWGKINSGDASFFNGQGFYDNYIVVHPTKSNVVLAGGIDIWRTTDGINFENVTNGYAGGNVHVDNHCAAIYPGQANVIYAGNDGGMYKSTDIGATWFEINNNLQVTQFYSFAVDHNQANRNVGGTQDNGTVGDLSGGVWSLVVGGDGFHTILDSQNPNVVFGNSTPGGRVTPFKLNTSTGSFQYLSSGLNTADGVWDPPIVQHPLIPDVMFHGRRALYYSYTGGSSWTVATTKLNNQGQFTAICASSVDENIVFAGTATGEVTMTKDVGETWTEITNNGLPNRYVRDIACSYEDAKVAYIVYSGFGTPHVFKTSDQGKSWLSISNGLPDIPVNAIEIHPTNERMLFIGTDIGVFASYDAGASWFPFGRKMARSPVLDLEFNKYYLTGGGDQVLRAATHGRSIWEVTVPSEDITSPEITSPIGGELYTSTTNQKLSWYGFKLPVNVEYSINNGQDWTPIASNVQGSSMLWNIPNRYTYTARIRVTSVSDPSQTRVSNTFTINLLAVGSVMQLGGVNYVAYGIAWDGADGLWSTSFYSNKLVKLNAQNFAQLEEYKLPGDSLYTDLTIDRDKKLIYLHKMESTVTGGGMIYVFDMNTKTIVKNFSSPAIKYPIGLELVDGKLIVGDRDLKDDNDGIKYFYILNPETGVKESRVPNSSQIVYGPRGLAYDRSKYMYQIVTDFPNAGALVGAYMQKIDKSNMSKEVLRMDLESPDGIINARGIEYDTRDKNFWVTDFSGNIYKVAGFEVVLSVENDNNLSKITNDFLEMKVYPNPIREFATVSFRNARNTGRFKVELRDMPGRNLGVLYDKTVESGNADYFTLDRNGLAQGTYFLTVSLDGKLIASTKIMVME